MKHLFLWVGILCTASAVYGIPEWHFFSYIEAANNVTTHGFTNLKAMLNAGSNEKLMITAQLDDRFDNKTHRFAIDNNHHLLSHSLPTPLGKNIHDELVNATQWAATTFSSQHFALILWNHGNGILDEPKGYARGILYNYEKNTYLNNQALESALKIITHNILGKKIDLLGMDACLMAMLEVAYQVQDYAEIFVASENVEPVPGWDYYSFLSKIKTTQTPLSAQECAKMIVESYGKTVKRSQFALSAIHLKKIDPIITNLNAILKKIAALSLKNKDLIISLVKQARLNTKDFFDRRYIDLGNFYYQLLTLMSENTLVTKIKVKKDVTETKELLSQGIELIKEAVFSYSGISTLTHCYGLSIYYPYGRKIHSSYLLTKFAQQHDWLSFIKTYSMQY